jgi:EAL domain-containing protein (putative c-di-GMP-specific phosphodiesterase class I)
MNAEAMQRLAFDSGLRHAIDLGEMKLHYQPQIDAGTGRLAGAEALLRWTNRDLGEVEPARFVPIAEENGSIIPIGEWVLQTACRAARDWHFGEPGSPRINVNLSAVQFKGGSLIAAVAGALQDSGLPPSALELELTESAILLDRKKTVSDLHRLKSMGVRIALDDFGTGYSALEYLRDFPVDTLKIDRIFALNVHTDPAAAALTASIIAMGRALGLRVVAEGIETKEQMAFFRKHGCDELQGFLISRPIPESEFRRLFANAGPFSL